MVPAGMLATNQTGQGPQHSAATRLLQCAFLFRNRLLIRHGRMGGPFQLALRAKSWPTVVVVGILGQSVCLAAVL